MLSKTSLRIAGAAMLGTAALLGTNAANAQSNLDTDTGGVTYARETVLTTGSLEVGDAKAKHYLLGQDDAHLLMFEAMVGVGAGTSDRTLIEYELSGAVFAVALTNDSLGMETATAPNVRLIGGGEEKGSTALFSITEDFNKTEVATLSARLAIGTGGSASIVMRARNVDLGAVLGMDSPSVMNDASYSGAVKLKSALEETAEATDVTTTVTSGFKKFMGDTTEPIQVSLGSFMIASSEAADNIFKANSPTAGDQVSVITEIALGTTEADMSYVVFSGDFSFASEVAIYNDAACSTGGGGDLRMMEGEGDDEVILETTDPVAVSAFQTAPRFLCITVDQPTEEDADEIIIPETAAYMVMATYEDIASAAFGTEGETHNLGRIMRDGTTVRLPFLTTYSKYNQRLVIVNRGNAAMYTISFTPEEGVMAVPGSDAGGTLAANSTTVINLADGNLVTLSGKTRTAGTLIVESEPTMIDVATTLVNIETGTTDTVVY